MRLSRFIAENMEEIQAEWETFARTLLPAAETMDSLALRNHSEQILAAIAEDIETFQTEREQSDKSKGLAPAFAGTQTAATTHGIMRQIVGFDIKQLAGEYRALRASVIRLWKAQVKEFTDSEFDEMLRFNEAIDQALAESIASYSYEVTRSRKTFLAILGHDLRSPLSNILMSAKYLLISETNNDRTLDVADRIKRNASTMKGMIEDLLEYAGGQLGRKMPIKKEAANMETICQRALEEIQPSYPDLIFNFESSGDLNGSFDPARFQQVLSNLLNNAAKYGDREAPVSFSAQGETETIIVQVKNSGRPILPESLQVIFNPLVQLSNESNADPHITSSLGLGLFIAREIVEGHGGTIEAESSEMEGTVFTVRVPRS